MHCTLKIAICDDSSFDRFAISEMLDDYFKDKSFSYHVNEYSNELTLIDDIEESNQYDIIFLDIYLNRLLGIDVARKLRDGGYRGKIVFLTASDKYAVESYDVDAAGYLLKPHHYEKFCGLMDKMLTGRCRNTLIVKRRGSIEHISYDSIRYIESSNTKCLIHCIDGKVHTVYTRLDLIEQEIRDRRFFRCHRSYLVNLYYVCRLDENFVMDNNEIVLIRKRSIRQSRLAYLEYHSGDASASTAENMIGA
jgi:DNA-binding LytR/AlgR family response regulator